MKFYRPAYPDSNISQTLIFRGALSQQKAIEDWVNYYLDRADASTALSKNKEMTIIVRQYQQGDIKRKDAVQQIVNVWNKPKSETTTQPTPVDTQKQDFRDTAKTTTVGYSF